MRARYLGLALPALLATVPAHAYLDPGTGNGIIYVFLSLFGAIGYFLKGLAYRLAGGRGRADASVAGRAADLVIHCEGRIHHATFRPIIDALIRRNQPFRYLTCDIEDPNLTIESELMLSRYIGREDRAFARLANLRCKLMLSTTPNIGTPGFPLKRSRGIETLAHVFHAVGGMSTYHKHSLDHYDVALLAGDYLLRDIRHLERLRKTKAKVCVTVGVPYFDYLAQAREPATAARGESPRKTVLVAPSWGTKSCLNVCGSEFLHRIIEGGYDLILRPHPYSWKVEPGLLDRVAHELRRHPESRVTLDRDVDPSGSMHRADVLVSEKSGVRFDFAFLYEKPVITIDMPISDRSAYEMADLESIWESEVEGLLGAVIGHDRIGEICGTIERSLRIPPQDLTTLRDLSLPCFGRSGERIAEWCIQAIGGERVPAL